MELFWKLLSFKIMLENPSLFFKLALTFQKTSKSKFLQSIRLLI